MPFEFDQVMRAPRDGILEVHCDPSFSEALGGMPKLGRRAARAGGRARCRPPQGAVCLHWQGVGSRPGGGGPEKLTWVTDTIFRPVTSTVAFVMLPDHYPESMTASGIERFVDEGWSF